MQDVLKGVILFTMLEYIQSKTRQEWRDAAFAYGDRLRILIRDNGEIAAAATFLGGLALALFFKLFVLLVALCLLAAYLIWYLAPESKPPL